MNKDSNKKVEDFLSHYGVLGMHLDIGKDFNKKVENFLSHYGVLGMKWGIRKDRRRGLKSKFFTKKQEEKKPKLKTVKEFSDEELRQMVNRLNLESQYVKLMPKTKKQKVEEFIAVTLLNFGKTTVDVYMKNQAVKLAKTLADATNEKKKE